MGCQGVAMLCRFWCFSLRAIPTQRSRLYKEYLIIAIVKFNAGSASTVCPPPFLPLLGAKTYQEGPSTCRTQEKRGVCVCVCMCVFSLFFDPTFHAKSPKPIFFGDFTGFPPDSRRLSIAFDRFSQARSFCRKKFPVFLAKNRPVLGWDLPDRI